MKLIDSLDLADVGQLLNVRLQNVAGDVPVASTAKIYYDTVANQAKVANGTAIDRLTNILESIGVGASPNGISVSAVAGKNQNISLALASAGGAGALSAAHYSLLAGATNANTPSTLVQRDPSGNFAAGTITATLTGTASNATNLNNQPASYYTNFANTTGTRDHTAISDFDAQVNTHALSALAVPTADVSMNTHKLTNLVDPTNPQDAATKAYVDGMASGLDVKASVRAASTANVAATYNATGGTSGRGQMTAAPNTLDGVSLAVNDRILLKNQTTGAQNGIWVVTTLGTGANGVWDRASDFDSDAEVTAGAFTFVEEGTANADTGWTLSTNNPITIGGGAGTSLTFTQFSSAGAFTQGNGISISGGVISAVGTANRITVGAGGIDIAATYVGQTSITTLGVVTTGTWQGTAVGVAYGGTGATTAAAGRANLAATGKYSQVLSTAATNYTVTHGLGTTNVIAEIFDNVTNEKILVDYTVTDANTVTVKFGAAQAANAWRVVVIG